MHDVNFILSTHRFHERSDPSGSSFRSKLVEFEGESEFLLENPLYYERITSPVFRSRTFNFKKWLEKTNGWLLKGSFLLGEQQLSCSYKQGESHHRNAYEPI